MMRELVTFAIFFAIAYAPHVVGAHKPGFHLPPKAAAHMAVLGSLVAHPVAIETLKGYVVHFLVYSGFVIGH